LAFTGIVGAFEHAFKTVKDIDGADGAVELGR